jgi:hypothetical protein
VGRTTHALGDVHVGDLRSEPLAAEALEALLCWVIHHGGPADVLSDVGSLFDVCHAAPKQLTLWAPCI